MAEVDISGTAPSVISGLLFDPTEWRESLVEAVKPGVLATITAGREAEIELWPKAEKKTKAETGTADEIDGSEFDTEDDTEDFLAGFIAAEYWTGINETTARDIEGKIADIMGMDAEELVAAAVAAGIVVALDDGTISGTVNRTDLIAASVVALFDDYEGGRVGAIAENEATNALNFGHVQGMKVLSVDGESIAKQWLTARDTKVRRTHVALEGVTVPVFDNFHVGSEEAPYPGWYGLSPAERSGCRCSLFAVDAEVIMAELVPE